MAIPLIYQGLIPTQEEGGLTPMQLALANYMIAGQQPFGVNNALLGAMKVFCSSDLQTPLDFNWRTGESKLPDLVRDITGISYSVRGEDLYLYRRAQDCAMDEERYEEVWLGKVKDVAEGTYAYYGRRVISGTVSDGSSYSSSSDPYNPYSEDGSFSFAGLQGSFGFDADGQPTGPSVADPTGTNNIGFESGGSAFA